MLKKFFIGIFVILSLTFATMAQADHGADAKPAASKNQPSKTMEDDSTTMAFAMVVSVYQNMETDAEFASIIDEMFVEIGKADPSIKFSGKFSEKSTDEQDLIVAKVKKIFTNENDFSTNWQYGMGESVGRLIAQFYTKVLREESLVEEDVLFDHLSEIQTFSAKTPKNFPKNLSDKLDEIASYADSETLADDPTQREIFEHLLELFQIIAPE